MIKQQCNTTTLEIQTIATDSDTLTIICNPFADPDANNVDVIAVVGQHINPLLGQCESRALNTILNETILYGRQEAGIPYAAFPMARSMVSPTINSLEAMGIIEIVSRGNREHVNIYRLNPDYEVVVGTITITKTTSPVISISIPIETITVDVMVAR